MVRIEGDVGAVSGADRADAAARGVHRDASGRRCGHEAQAGGAAQHRHRPGRPRADAVRVRVSGRAGARRLPRVPVGVRVRRIGAGVQRSAVPARRAQVVAPLPARLRGRGPRGAAGTAQWAALRGDGVGVSVGALRRLAARLARRVAAGDEPGGGGDREGVVQLRAEPGALGVVRRAELHAPADGQAQGGGLGPAATRRCRGRSAWRCWRPSWRRRRRRRREAPRAPSRPAAGVLRAHAGSPPRQQPALRHGRTSAWRRCRCSSCSRRRSWRTSARWPRAARARTRTRCSAWRASRATTTSGSCSTACRRRTSTTSSTPSPGISTRAAASRPCAAWTAARWSPWDGTEFFRSRKIRCDNCSTRKRADGGTEHFHQMLAANVVAPGRAQSLPLPPEFVAAPGRRRQAGLRTAGRQALAGAPTAPAAPPCGRSTSATTSTPASPSAGPCSTPAATSCSPASNPATRPSTSTSTASARPPAAAALRAAARSAASTATAG